MPNIVNLYQSNLDWLQKNLSVAIFGAGTNGVKIKNYLESQGTQVSHFYDNDKSKADTTLCGLPVFQASTENLLKAEAIVIASTWHYEIYQQLKLIPGLNFIDLSIIGDSKLPFVDNIERKLTSLKNKLSDEESIKWLDQFYRYLNNDIPELPKSTYPQYIHPSYKDRKLSPIIDGGAWQGDSIPVFKAAFGEDVDIIGFEPELDNLSIALDNNKKYLNSSVKIENIGLWDSATTLKFNSSSQIHSASCNISSDGDIEVQVCTLDQYCKEANTVPQLIKLDVEGADLAAIKGAKGLIIKYKPCLAVCLYHDFDDLWNIPELIHSYRSDYEMYIGHHGKNWHETVLYCV